MFCFVLWKSKFEFFLNKLSYFKEGIKITYTVTDFAVLSMALICKVCDFRKEYVYKLIATENYVKITSTLYYI